MINLAKLFSVSFGLLIAVIPINDIQEETELACKSYNKYVKLTVQDLIKKYANIYSLDPRLIDAVILQESRGKHSSISNKGAIGLMQLMPSTAKSLGIDPYDIEENLKGGIKYLADNIKKFNGNIRIGLAAYNSGARNVSRYKGIPPFKETQKYVKNICNTYNECDRA